MCASFKPSGKMTSSLDTDKLSEALMTNYYGGFCEISGVDLFQISNMAVDALIKEHARFNFLMRKWVQGADRKVEDVMADLEELARLIKAEVCFSNSILEDCRAQAVTLLLIRRLTGSGAPLALSEAIRRLLVERKWMEEVFRQEKPWGSALRHVGVGVLPRPFVADCKLVSDALGCAAPPGGWPA